MIPTITAGRPHATRWAEQRATPSKRAALTPLFLLGAAVAGLLIALAHGYGYHRDELYFLVAGHHLAWSYPDQGPLTPLLARLMSDLAPSSLTVLRIPSALMAGGCVVVSGLIASEFGGSKRAQLIAAACTAAAPAVLVVGHLLSTSTYDLLAWSLVTWLVCRAIRTRSEGLWLLVGLIAGTALLNKPLIALLLASIVIAIGFVGPRRLFGNPWAWLGMLIAAAIWSPWLVWQAGHGWPQLHVSSAIANGSSTSSQPRWAFIPFQFLLAGPPLAPVWVAGLVGLARRPGLRPYRWLAVSWVVLAVIFEVSGGKPYYLLGLLPALFGAGALEVDGWLTRGEAKLRRNILLAAVLASAAVSAVIALPILPVKDAGPAVAMNPDAGETIGWPDYVNDVATAFNRARQPAVIFTSNYGEAGAVDRFGPRLGLPNAFSGHNGFGEWGPPAVDDGSVVVVGLKWPRPTLYFRGCHPVLRISNAAGIHNDEHGRLVAVCAGPLEPWKALWPRLKHLS